MRIERLLLAGLFAGFGLAQQYVVTTFAGGAAPPAQVVAQSVQVGLTRGVAFDSGNVYFSAMDSVYKIDSAGTMTRIAGNGRPGYSGDGGPGPLAQLTVPGALALDGLGNLYIADSGNRVVRKLTPGGTISTVPGSALFPSGNYTSSSYGVAVDNKGNLYVPDGHAAVYLVSPAGAIATFAGNGSGADSGDNGPALAAGIAQPVAVAVDQFGNVFIAEPYLIRKVTPGGIISSVAGTGVAGETGDGGQATSARIGGVSSLAVDSAGALYLGDGTRIRKVSANGVINTIVGGTLGQSTGDGGPASSAGLSNVTGVAVTDSGELYISDNQLIRQVSADGIIATIMGRGASFTGDNGPATAGQLVSPSGITLDRSGNIFVADNASRIRKISSSGSISTYAGEATTGASGDGGPAINAQMQLYSPTGLALDSSGNLFISEWLDADIRKVSSDGVITALVGNLPFQSFAPFGLATDAAGNLFIADSRSKAIRKVAPSGSLSVFAGGTPSSHIPYQLAVDGTDRVYVSYQDAFGVTRYDASGNPTELAPTAFSGEPVTVDSSGTIYAFVAGQLAKIAPDGTVTPIAATSRAYPVDGSSALVGAMISPSAIALDAAGDIFVADSRAGAVFKIQPASAPSPPTIAYILNSASNNPPPAAPGEIVTLYGVNIGPPTLTQGQLNAGSFTTQIAGTQVFFDGKPAPLIYVSATQTAAVVPYEVSGSTLVTLSYQGQTSAGMALPVAPSAPGLFTADSSGQAQAAAINQGGSLNSAAQPASIGDVVVFFATGEGQTTPAGVDGALSGNPGAVPLLPVTLTIGGKQAILSYAAEAPGEIAGLLQINAQIPDGITPGPHVPVTLQVGTVSAVASVTIAVK